MLFVTWLKDPFRPTRDLNLLGYGFTRYLTTDRQQASVTCC
jgi:hypothetical protein